MKLLIHRLLFIYVLIFLTSCSRTFKTVETVKVVDVDRVANTQQVAEERWSYILSLDHKFENLGDDGFIYVSPELDYRTTENFKFMRDKFMMVNETNLEICKDCGTNNSNRLQIPEKYKAYFKFTDANDEELLSRNHTISYYSPIYELDSHPGYEYFVQSIFVSPALNSNLGDKNFEIVLLEYFIKANDKGMFVEKIENISFDEFTLD